MRIAKGTLRDAYFHLSLFVLAISECVVMTNESVGSSLNYAYFVSFTFLVWSLFVLRIFSRGYRFEFPSTTILMFDIYFIWAIFITATVQPDPKITQYFLHIFWIALPFLVANTVYYFTLHRGNNNLFHANITIIVAMLLYTYYEFYDVDNIVMGIHFGTSYYPFFLLPLIMVNRHVAVRVIGFLLVSIVLFSSVKRGGVMALFAGTFVYIVVWQWIKGGRNILLKLAVVLLIVGVCAGLFIYLGTMGDNNIFERFENVEKDNGSGRVFVWGEAWRLIINQNIAGFFIGHGYNAVVDASRYAFSAHNDYLEAWYDFGFIGVALYVLAVISMFIANLRAIMLRKPYAPAFSLLSTMFTILSMLSHIGIYYWMSFVMIDMAYFIGRMDYERRRAGAVTEVGKHVEI